MTTVNEIKTAIKQLTIDELRELRTWYELFEAEQWDVQIEADVVAGRLDALADEAIRDFQTGTATEL
ncbi:MAG: hypothetical protein AB4911_18990 [Oscillochloridaceae bacterium umkhey_bin13]